MIDTLRGGVFAAAVLMLACPLPHDVAFAQASAPGLGTPPSKPGTVRQITGPARTPAQPAQPAPPAGSPPAPRLAPQQQAAATPTFPGGALSLRETHGDWAMQCGVDRTTNAKACVVRQEQADAKSRQHLLTMQVQPATPASLGVLVLPFGLLLDSGVTLRIDPASAATAGAIGTSTLTLRVRTCLPAGCIVPLTLDVRTLTAVRTAKALIVTARVAETGQNVDFSISPKGFGSAFDRAVALMQ